MSLQSSQVLRAMGLAVSITAIARPGYAQVAQPGVDDLRRELVVGAVIRDFRPVDNAGTRTSKPSPAPRPGSETALALKTVTAPGTTAMYD